MFLDIIARITKNSNGECLMMSEQPSRPNGVIGPTGKPLAVDNLQAAGTKRWVIRRKAEVVTAVHNGLIGMDEACDGTGYRSRNSSTGSSWSSRTACAAASGSRELKSTGNLSTKTILPKGCPETG